MVITPDKIVILSNEVTGEALEKLMALDNDPKFLLKIMMSEVVDIIFPPLEKLLADKKFAIMIKLGNSSTDTRVNFNNEEGFLKCRAVFSECIKTRCQGEQQKTWATKCLRD
eukprot:GABU01006948.1.p2 GENE.GABU01006948.1~~GABU01006948.1.p2  ORF type:complete len:112 (+),score=35.94 GABU01006948.1:51-386(+)